MDPRHERFEQLAPALVEPLRRYLVRRTDPGLVDEVLADTLLVCRRRLDQVPADDALPWAYGVARSCLTHAERRRGGRRRRARLRADGGGDAVRVLGALPAGEAEALRLWAWEELDPERAAVVLATSSGSASARAERARRQAVRRLEVEDDTSLRDLLRSQDPARGLELARAEDVERLMSATRAPDGGPAATRESGLRRRGALTWLVAAAAVALIAAVAVFALLRSGPEKAVVPAPGGAGGADDPTTTVLAVPETSSARCMVPDAEVLAGQSMAFEGTVRQVDDTVAVLEPLRFYAGEVTDLVEVRAPDAELHALLGAVALEVGEDYLVSASEGRMTLCGLSGPASPELRALYEDAFPD